MAAARQRKPCRIVGAAGTLLKGLLNVYVQYTCTVNVNIMHIHSPFTVVSTATVLTSKVSFYNVSSSINCFVLFAASEAVEEISWTKTDASICHTLTVHWTPPDVCVQNGVIVSYAILNNGSKVCVCVHEPNDHLPGLGFGYDVVNLQNNECACPILYKHSVFFRYHSLCANWSFSQFFSEKTA